MTSLSFPGEWHPQFSDAMVQHPPPKVIPWPLHPLLVSDEDTHKTTTCETTLHVRWPIVHTIGGLIGLLLKFVLESIAGGMLPLCEQSSVLQASIQSLLPRLHYFDDGICIVHHMFGAQTTDLVRQAYGDALLSAHFEVGLFFCQGTTPVSCRYNLRVGWGKIAVLNAKLQIVLSQPCFLIWVLHACLFDRSYSGPFESGWTLSLFIHVPVWQRLLRML